MNVGSDLTNGIIVKTGEMVARSIRSQIASGELEPGDRLMTEDELMVSFHLARPTVREGLRILESQGLIEIQRGRHGGGVIKHPSDDHLAQSLALSLQLRKITYRDLEEAALVIEPGLAGRLAQSHTTQDIEELTRIVDRAAEAAARNDRISFGAAVAEFHEEVVTRSGNVTLATMARLLRELRAEYYVWASTVARDKSLIELAARSYRRLVRLIEIGDSSGAEEHWRMQVAYTSYNAPEQDRPIRFTSLE
jgi:GntR family transcriptional regulator, transcriptional repressor for pyruvate dehydrogenase complex